MAQNDDIPSDTWYRTSTVHRRGSRLLDIARKGCGDKEGEYEGRVRIYLVPIVRSEGEIEEVDENIP